MLERFGLSPRELMQPDGSLRARPLMLELVRVTLDHFREALDYMLAISSCSVRLRLACLWPIVIGLETLLLLVQNEQWLDPEKVSKVRRNDVYRILACSLPVAPSNAKLRSWVERLIGKIEARLKA
jgi:farnesyl-diphosphate farnesyltransferase